MNEIKDFKKFKSSISINVIFSGKFCNNENEYCGAFIIDDNYFEGECLKYKKDLDKILYKNKFFRCDKCIKKFGI